ncbi:MAG TPA: response regulator [Bacteroidota bacterium]|nr:response regulator [Bacteroidota bacterium]
MPKKLAILIVDDEDALRTLVRHELESDGFVIDEAESGERAVELLGEKKFDIVILDIRMPGIDGLEVLRRIREDDAITKVIMLTGVGELKIARDSLTLGANDFLMKPYDFTSLKNCIKRVLKE